MLRIGIRSLLIILGLLFLSPSLATSTTIYYTPINLSGSIWEYQYKLVGFPTPTKDYGFTIYFDETLYANLSNPTASADWDVITWNPIVPPPSPGGYDALALVDGASLSPFSIDFTWLGHGTPGSQPFDIYYSTTSDFTLLENGTTSVPEPATALLLVAGFATLPWARRWMGRRG